MSSEVIASATGLPADYVATKLIGRAKRIEALFGMYGTSQTFEVYTQLAGQEPEARSAVDVPPAFSGSAEMKFKLELWPTFDFRVVAHPKFGVWRRRFESPVPNDEDLYQAGVWHFTYEHLERVVHGIRLVDGWEDDRSVECCLPNGTLARGDFSFGLVQCWSIV